MTTQPARYAFTVDDYHRMADAGVLDEDERLELLRGEVVRMSPIGKRHAACVKRLNAAFAARLRDRAAVISVQDPVHLTEYSEPQPDVALLHWREDFYEGAAPTAADVLLLIEVTESSIGVDREVKVPLYAAAGVPEVWLVDLDGAAVEVYRDPSARGYAHTERRRPGEQLRPAGLSNVELDTGDVLGRPRK